MIGGTLYLCGRDAVTGELLRDTTSCSMCRRTIINAGIAQVVIRNTRRDAIEALKKAQKAGTISEDAQHEAEDEVQKLTDKKVKDVDALVSAKEKDILTV